ncbi:hypothetical protein H8958_022193 [Nasalis larvatus]
MIAGSGTRAHARARLGNPWLTDGPCNPRSLVPAAPSAPRTAARLSGLVPAGNSVRRGPLDAVPGQRSGPTVAAGFPQGGVRAWATPRWLPGHFGPLGARGAQRGGSRDPAHGSRPAEAGVSAQCREMAQELWGEVQGRSFALSEPDGDTAGPEPHGSFPGPPGGRDRLASRVRTRVRIRMPRRPRRLFPPAPQRRPSGSQTAEGPAWASGSRGCTRTQSHSSETRSSCPSMPWLRAAWS